MDKANKGLFTMIGEGTTFEGTINVPHSIRVDGTVKGKIETSEVLTVGSAGIIEADVKAKSAIVGGRIQGNVIVEDRIELEQNAVLIGDVRTRDIVINEGAVFHGNCSMENSKAVKV